jgi:hypothetical protein
MIFLDPSAVIPKSKLTQYLLIHLPRDDKSGFLAQAGYTLENWQQLEHDLRTQILPLAAVATVRTEFGQKYEIRGVLIGINGTELSITTVWIVTSEETRFVTLVPGY